MAATLNFSLILPITPSKPPNEGGATLVFIRAGDSAGVLTFAIRQRVNSHQGSTVLITQQEVEALAQKRGLVLEFPKAWALNKWDIELVKPQPEGTKPPAEPRKVLQTNNVGDLCRFLGKDGYTEMAGKQIRRTEPTIFHLWHHDGTLLHKFTGPVALMRD